MVGAMIAAAALALAPQKAPPKEYPKDASPYVRVSDQGTQPHLALDADGGTVAVVFLRDGKVHLALSTDGGAAFPPPRAAFDAPLPLRHPRVALDKQKRVWISVASGDPPRILLAASKDRGQTFGKPALVSEASAEGLHALAAGPAEAHAAWVEPRDSRTALLYAKYTEPGKRSGKTLVVSPSACERCSPALAVDPKGQPALAWRDGPQKDPKAGRPTLLAVSTAFGASFPPPVPASSVDTGLLDCPGEGPSVAFNGALVAAAWMDPRQLGDLNVVWTHGPSGAKTYADAYVHDDRRYGQRRPSVALDADGAAWCAWEDGALTIQRLFVTNSNRTLYLPVGDVAKEVRFGAPCLAAAGKRVLLAYESGDGVAVRILAAP
jgi:hypothetical protein